VVLDLESLGAAFHSTTKHATQSAELEVEKMTGRSLPLFGSLATTSKPPLPVTT
jgi:hypothetical protein